MESMEREVYQRAEPRRLRVLLSAYACEPNKGSEPEVGWRWALNLARHHQVTVVTRANNQSTIEAGLADEPSPHPDFIYFDLPLLAKWKRKWLPTAVYYSFWQVGVRWHLRKRLSEFDVVHHITFNSFRQPGFWWFCPVPVVLGPLGGGQVFPRRFASLLGGQKFAEFARSLSVIASPLLPHLWISFGFAARILVANRDTANRIPRLFRKKVSALLETGIPIDLISRRNETSPGCASLQAKARAPIPAADVHPPAVAVGNRIVWLSRLEGIKAPELALRALAQARGQNPSLWLTMVGPGPLREAMERLARELGVDGAVEWRGKVPHSEVFSILAQHDIFLFTSLRDTSGNVLLEAMAGGLPAVTLIHHGAAEIATDETAIRVPVRTISETVAGIADGLNKLAGSAELRTRLGLAAQDRVAEVFAWHKKAEQVSAIYQALVPAGLGPELQRKPVSAIQSKIP